MQTYKLATWNIAGIQSASNLLILKDVIKNENLDVLCIQECPFNEFDMYDYTFIPHLNSISSKNVAFIIRKDIPIQNIFHHPDGKILGITTECFSVIGIHAPSGNNYKHQREIFFSSDVACFFQNFHQTCILLGDMNCVLAPIDSTAQFNYSPALHELITTYQLLDIWRTHHPHDTQYTYHYSKGASRLDVIFLPQELSQQAHSTNIIKLPVSDHSMVIMKCQFKPIKHLRHSFQWKFNDSLLQQEDYRELISQEIRNIKTHGRYQHLSPVYRWLAIKNKLIYITKHYARELAQLKREQFNYYYGRLNTLTSKLHTNPHLLPEVRQAQAELKRLYSLKLQGIVIRSRLTHIPDIEPSLLHIRENKKRQSQTFINDYYSSTGTRYHGEQIYEVISQDFAAQFLARSQATDYHLFFTPDLPILQPEDSSGLTETITCRELQNVLHGINPHASPGMDGLTPKWYQLFFNEIQSFLLPMYNDFFSCSTMPTEFCKILGILIPKDPHHVALSTTRFLSIYNVDYKLFAKLMVTRLQQVITSILHPHQYGVPGAPPIYILLCQLRDFIQYQNVLPNSSNALLSTDFTRAFDSLSLTYLFDLLRYLKFPPEFLQAIYILYTNRRVTMKINGRYLSAFPMTTGLSQGCPLSSLMFSLAMTPFMYRIHNLLSGFSIHRSAISALSYIDDFTYILQSPSDAKVVFSALHEFGIVSGISVNTKKSHILCFCDHTQGLYANICSVQSHIKILGIHWYRTIQQTIHYNGDVLIGKMVAIMQHYKHALNTLLAKIYFVNIYVFSQLYYFLQILPLHEKQYALINKFVGYYVWSNSILRVRRTQIITPLSQGGLNLKDIRLQGYALRFHRTLQIICNYQNTFSYDLALHILHYIDTTAPLHTRPWRKIFPELVDVYVELAYFAIQRLDFDDYTTKTLYSLFFCRTYPDTMTLRNLHPTCDWTIVFQNFSFLTNFPPQFDIWYRILYNIYPTDSRLFEFNISNTNLCPTCLQRDDIQHRLTACSQRTIIWNQYLRFVSLLLHTTPRSLQFEQLILYPEYRYFPPKKRKFLIWLTAFTIDYLLRTSGQVVIQSYKYFLHYHLQLLTPEKIMAYFSGFYKVIYM